MHFLHDILSDPAKALLIIFNLVIIESLLSVDNAAVLATMVMDLPKEQRGKALRYGIFGAYIFRGASLVLAAWLVHIWWLKAAGGAYLLYLSVNYFAAKATPEKEDDPLNKSESWIYKKTKGFLSAFWATVILVEVMDMAFSIDNVFAAVAFTDNILLICAGVFIGILAMRFVAQGFVKLMEKYAFLETSAFIVIFLLGLKLSVTLWTHFTPLSPLALFLESHTADLYVSIGTMTIFLLPLLTSALFGWPKREK
ncbi:MAG TPA: TerC family protein [Bacteroidia bacterium]|nr:TerC family protein [Bacteroidia bacterium]